MKIVIGGDFVIQNRCLEMVNEGDYGFLDNVKRLFKSSDYSIVNLEAPIKTENSEPIVKIGPNLQMPIQSLDLLKDIGVTNVTLANNHIMDYGNKALDHTITQLKSHEIGFVGAGMSAEEAASPMILEKENLKVGILNYCENEFSIVTDEAGGANPLNCVAVYNAIRKLRSEVDYIIIITHSGHENFHLPSMKMVEEYRYMIDLGADLVINHHQHCVSGVEEYKGKKIYYGIGNLCFDKLGKVNSTWYEGMLVSINITADNLTTSYIPYQWQQNPFRLELLSSDIDDIQRKIEFYSSVISSPDSHKEKLKEYYLYREKGILNTFEPYNNRICNKLLRMNLLPRFMKRKKLLKVLNLIECESHRIATINALQNKIYK